MRLGGIGADGEADRLAHFVLVSSRGPGARQVTLGSVSIARGEVRREVTEIRRLGVERALLVLPRRDHLVFHQKTSVGPRSLSLTGSGPG